MKIAITGHSKGIGKALYDHLIYKGHTCIGFSRSNGYDLEEKQKLIIKGSLSSDVFVNNAWKGYEQINILTAMWEQWKYNENKTIVNISSLSKYPGLSGNKSGYSAQKAALSHQAFLLMFQDPGRKCRMININPGYVETDMTNHVKDANMLTALECAECIEWAITRPQHVEIGELSVWRPY